MPSTDFTKSNTASKEEQQRLSSKPVPSLPFSYFNLSSSLKEAETSILSEAPAPLEEIPTTGDMVIPPKIHVSCVRPPNFEFSEKKSPQYFHPEIQTSCPSSAYLSNNPNKLTKIRTPPVRKVLFSPIPVVQNAKESFQFYQPMPFTEPVLKKEVSEKHTINNKNVHKIPHSQASQTIFGVKEQPCQFTSTDVEKPLEENLTPTQIRCISRVLFSQKPQPSPPHPHSNEEKDDFKSPSPGIDVKFEKTLIRAKNLHARYFSKQSPKQKQENILNSQNHQCKQNALFHSPNLSQQNNSIEKNFENATSNRQQHNSSQNLTNFYQKNPNFQTPENPASLKQQKQLYFSETSASPFVYSVDQSSIGSSNNSQIKSKTPPICSFIKPTKILTADSFHPHYSNFLDSKPSIMPKKNKYQIFENNEFTNEDEKKEIDDKNHQRFYHKPILLSSERFNQNLKIEFQTCFDIEPNKQTNNQNNQEAGFEVEMINALLKQQKEHLEKATKEIRDNIFNIRLPKEWQEKSQHVDSLVRKTQNLNDFLSEVELGVQHQIQTVETHLTHLVDVWKNTTQFMSFNAAERTKAMCENFNLETNKIVDHCENQAEEIASKVDILTNHLAKRCSQRVDLLNFRSIDRLEKKSTKDPFETISLLQPLPPRNGFNLQKLSNEVRDVLSDCAVLH